MGKGLKIFVIGPRGFPGVQGGIERFSEGLYPRLVETGHDVTTFAMKRYCSHAEWKGVKFVYSPTLPFKSLEKTFYNFYTALYCIYKRPDIVHVHSIASGLFIFLMKLFALKIVARYNSRDYLHSKWNAFGKMILRNSEKQFLLADHIITNNKEYEVLLQSMSGQNNISFIPNGVEIPNKDLYLVADEERFAELIGHKKLILYVGRITPEKNIPTLLKAFTLIEDRKNLTLLIAGDSAQDTGYFTSLKTQFVDDAIIFAGRVKTESLRWLYANCSLFVLPSLHEGMPNALLEAMSFNCKILASRIPAHAHFHFTEDSYFEATDPIELKEKMVKKITSDIYEDHDAKLSLHQWPAIVKQIDEIHQQVLSR